VVEGFSSINAQAQNGVRDAVRIREHILCRHAQHLKPLAFEPFGSNIVPLRPISEVMGETIHFDRKVRGGAVKIQDVRPDRMLPAEAHISAA
jgi:hypothetical protein